MVGAEGEPIMPKRLPCEAAILAALLLGSCENMPRAFTQNDRERLNFAEINLERAARASSEMVDRVERGERRIEALEQGSLPGAHGSRDGRGFEGA